MKSESVRRIGAGFAALTGAAMIAGAVQGADFSGERIGWIGPFKAGGGSDRWARFYAPMLAENFPGGPVIVVKNILGGGSTSGANQFQARARSDGLTILGTSGSTRFPYLLGDRRVRYEYENWHVVLATPTGGVFFVSSALGIKSAAELPKLKGRDLKYGALGATSLDLVPLLAFEMLGLDVKAVMGMKGKSAPRLAFERDEVNLDYQATPGYLKKAIRLVEDGKAVPIMAWGVLDAAGNVVRDSIFPDLPSFPEAYALVHGLKPKGDAWDAWKAFFTAGFPAQKMLFLPGGTPPDIVDAYRDAAARAVAAPGFAEKARIVLGNYPQMVGEAADQVKAQAITVPPKARKWIQDWLTRKYGVKF